MKTIKIIEENTGEGLMSLMGQRVTFFCLNYIYTGELTGVNDVQVKLENAGIVYETGDLKSKDWKDIQLFPNPIYIRLNTVESYMVLK